MRRVALLSVLVLGLMVALVGAAGAPPVRAESTAGAVKTRVLVVLKSQEDVSKIKASTRVARVNAVVRALRARATATQKSLRGLLQLRKAQGKVSLVSPLWILNAIEVTAEPDVIQELASRPEVQSVEPVTTIQAPEPAAAATAELNIERVNAPALWGLGFRGQGIVVANMDTGVDGSHPELAARWRGGTNSWYDPNGQHPTTPVDVSGHGTETMGVMVGGDAGGTSIGMAPDAKWIAVKIFNDSGFATTVGIHRGFQWLLDPDGNPATADAPNVVNNSWTMGSFGCNLEFQLDLRNLRAASILPVFAAGNSGPTANTSLSPANNPEALAVGATNDVDGIASFSSRGSSSCEQPIYPQVSAPGVDIETTGLYGLYTSQSGTSLAAPHVSGALALLLSAFPNLPVDRQEAALETGAVDLGVVGPDDAFGFGRLDARTSYDWLNAAPDFTVSAGPSSLSAAPGSAVSYSVSVAGVNGFADDVSLSLNGLSASEATWTFTPQPVAGGSGTSELVVTTAPSLPGGSYPLKVTASSGATTHTASVTLIVTAPDLSLSASPSTQTVVVGNTVSYSVGVTSLNGFVGDVSLALSGLPSAVGTATFTPGVVSVAGTSDLTISTAATAAPGTYPLTVTGTSGGTTHTASVTLVLVPSPDFSLGASPSSRTVVAGNTGNYTVTVTALNGFVGDVSLSLNGLPADVGSSTFTPATVSSAGTSQLTISTPSTASPGTYPLTIIGLSGATTHTTSVTLVVAPAPGFSLSVTPTSRTINRGQSTYYPVSIASVGGFHGNVSLSLSGKPSSATASFSMNPVVAPGTSRLNLRAGGSTPRGTYKLKITGVSGTVSHSVTATLVIR